ncbi:MAG: mobilization protein [Rhodoferax sp.]|nr:mobilization protein [Rhodoferax sp.]
MATTKQIEELEQKLKTAKAQLKAKEQQIAARKRTAESKAERTLENRKKILLGAMTLDMMKRKPEQEKNIMDRLNVFLTRDSERAVFGLLPKREAVSTASASVQTGVALTP